MWLLLSLVSAQALSLPALTDAEKKQLEKLEAVIHPMKPTDNKGIGVKSFGVVDAPPSEVWPVVRDCEHFSKFMPRTKESVARVEDGTTICHVVLNMPFPLANLWADTKSVLREDEGGVYQRTWSLVKGTYHRNNGSWTLHPWGAEGKQTLVVYMLDTDPAILIPDGILRSAQVGSLPEVFKAIRTRVAALRK
jgi:uncharacterized membrane protein